MPSAKAAGAQPSRDAEGGQPGELGGLGELAASSSRPASLYQPGPVHGADPPPAGSWPTVLSVSPHQLPLTRATT